MSEVATRRCKATNREGEPCEKAPIKGGDVCWTHGGATRQAQTKAKTRLLEAKVRGQLQRVEIEPVTNPIGELAYIGGEVLAWHDLCRDNLADLRSFDYEDEKGVQDVAAYVAVYERALDRAVVTMERMARLGLDAETLRRQLQIEAERPSREQADALGRVLDTALALADVDPDTRARIVAAFPQALAKEGLTA